MWNIQLVNRFPSWAPRPCLSVCLPVRPRSSIRNNRLTRKRLRIMASGTRQAGRRTTCTCSRGGVTQKLPRHILDLSFHTNAASLLSRAVNKEKGSSGNMKSQTREKLLHLRWFKKIIFQVLSRAIYGFSRIPPSNPVQCSAPAHFRLPTTLVFELPCG